MLVWAFVVSVLMYYMKENIAENFILILCVET